MAESAPTYALLSYVTDDAGTTTWDLIGWSSRTFGSLQDTPRELAKAFARKGLIQTMASVNPSEPINNANPTFYFMRDGQLYMTRLDPFALIDPATRARLPPGFLPEPSQRVQLVPMNGFGDALVQVQSLPMATLFLWNQAFPERGWSYVAQVLEPFVPQSIGGILWRQVGIAEFENRDADSVGVSSADGRWSVWQRDNATMRQIA